MVDFEHENADFEGAKKGNIKKLLRKCKHIKRIKINYKIYKFMHKQIITKQKKTKPV